MQTSKKYQLATPLNLSINSPFEVTINLQNQTFKYDSIILQLLPHFTSPFTLKEISSRITLIAKNKSKTIELLSTINKMVVDKLLIPDHNISPTSLPTNYWGAQNIHKKMLNDTVRTHRFEKAIAENVKDKIVIDIGCGTGILSFFALRHGAKHVYAIDSNSKCIEYSKALAKTNNFKNITFINKSCFDVKLPQKADVLISEVIGNSPLSEHILDIFEDAKKRLLVANPIIIPQNLKIFAIPIEFSTESIDNTYFTKKDCSNWENEYNFDFKALLYSNINQNDVFFIDSKNIDYFKKIGIPILLEEYDFLSDFSKKKISKSINMEINCSGKLCGMLIYFESNLSNSTTLGTNPDFTSAKNHWKYEIHPFNANSIKVAPKQIINLKLKTYNTKVSFEIMN